MLRRHRDWLAQAVQNLKAAEGSLEGIHYEWFAFQIWQRAVKKGEPRVISKELLRYDILIRGGETCYSKVEQGDEDRALYRLVEGAA